ncbi:MAG TPA: OmpA family protein [Solirubrobacteraceae bacterium]|nr:OmpA family protein [Solirubrobacteraceae bacterium]
MAMRPPRRLARTSLLAGSLLAVALAAPSMAAAQQSYEPSGNGKLLFSDDSAQVQSVWPAGSHWAHELQLPDSYVGAYTASGERVTLARPGVPEAYRVDLGDPFSSQAITDPNLDPGGVLGLAADPYSNDVAVASASGLVVGDPETPGSWGEVVTGVPGLGAGRVAWGSGGGVKGTLVWDGILNPVDHGGDPELPVTTPAGDSSGEGIWAREGDGTIHEIVTDTSAANPSVSQDGKVIAWEQNSESGLDTDIYVLDRNDPGAGAYKIAGNTLGNDKMPAVSPDGTQVAFYNEDTQKIVRVRLDGLTPQSTVYLADGGVSGLAWQPADTPVAGGVQFSGTLAVGQTLTASAAGPNTRAEIADDTYLWEACDDVPGDGPDPSCTQVATTAAYTVKAGDVGKRLRAVRVAANAAGTDSSYSTRTVPVPAPAQPQPAPEIEAPTFTDDVPEPFIDAPYPQFGWTPAQPGGTFECLLRPALLGDLGAEYTPCTSPAKGSTPLTSGEYEFFVRQVDANGNKGKAARYAFTVDQDPPVKPTLVSGPEATTTSTTATFTFSNPSNEITTYECRLDARPTEQRIIVGPQWEACTSPHTVQNLAVGEHKMEIRQVDRAGNHSMLVSHTWDVKEKPPVVDPPVVDPPVVDPPVVEQPVEEKPVEPKPEPKPETQTPAPAVQTPAVETPAKPAAVAPAPVVKPAPAKAPALVATIGGTKSGAQVGANGGTSSAATIEVAKESVGVGCSITGTVLKSCKVDLYAPKASGATARAAAAEQVLVGTGTYEAKDGSSKMDVRIELNATGKAMLRANPGGLKVTVKISGKPVSGPALKATGVAKLVTDRASATVGGFAVNSAKLTSQAKAQLRTLAQFGKAATVRCVGHTDGSTDDAAYLKGLGAKRAKAVCAYLAAHGVKVGKATLASKGATQPLATNATKAGRAKNRRVQVTLVR